MIQEIWTHDHHPNLCGVAKFSDALAARLGVPCRRMRATHHRHETGGKHVLLSIKGAELCGGAPTIFGGFDVFAHDAHDYLDDLIRNARRVYAASAAVADAWREKRPDVIAAWCPSLLQGNPTRATYNVLTFGMAHKLQIDRYVQLKADLDAEWGDDYTVSVSTAVHEGSPWDSTAEVADKLRVIFGLKLRVLGYLADDALAREIEACDAIALYFPDGVRENNTTFWAAVDSGKRIFTNFDAQSPTASHPHTWDRLVEVIRAA